MTDPIEQVSALVDDLDENHIVVTLEDAIENVIALASKAASNDKEREAIKTVEDFFVNHIFD